VVRFHSTADASVFSVTDRKDPAEILNGLLGDARRAGADAADAVFVASVAASVSYRLGRLEELERAESWDLGLRVFIGEKVAFVSSTDLARDTLAELPARAVAMARLAPEDKFAGLAPAERLAAPWPNLDLEDTQEPAAKVLIERAKAVEGAAMAVPGITNSEGGGASFGRSELVLATSEGFFGRYAGTSHGIGVAVVAGEGTRMERDYDSVSARHTGDLESAEAVGRHAGERTVARLDPRKAKSQAVPVVFEPRVSSGLLGHFAGAISGASIARGVSFLKGEMGKQIFASDIVIVDDPHRPRGLRSKPFDGEGVRNKRMPLVENGVLKTWILDCASAKQLGLETTGHAARGTGGPPSPSTTNLYMKAGTLSPEELIVDIAQGFYVTELIGMGVNMVTGDYSRGASGFWIENGKIAWPVSGVTIAGNLKDMFRRATPASDLVFRYGTNAPTLRVEGMTVAGE
jgi:PmbA protein